MPITETAIARVEALALHEKQPLVQASGLVVEWRPNQPIDDTEYHLDYEYQKWPHRMTHLPAILPLSMLTKSTLCSATLPFLL